MTDPSPDPHAFAQLMPATRAHEAILANLLQLYAHDFSEFYDIEINSDGRFTYTELPLYFTDPGRHPFLISIGERLAGFVLVQRGSKLTGNQTAWDMAEFFILRAHRRRGLGTRIAHQVWRRIPGPWEVRVLCSNPSAENFWANAIGGFTGQPAQPTTIFRSGPAWHLFCFESNGAG